MVALARNLPTATLHEAGGKIGALPSAIKPVAPGFKVCGTAFTIHSPGNNLWLHRALVLARPGDVLVVYANGAYEHGYWGEVMTTQAKTRGLNGLVIDGGVRDADLLEQIGFPVFSRGLSIRGTGKDYGAIGWLNAAVSIGKVTVSPGDLIVGDRDGVVAIPRDRPPKWSRRQCSAKLMSRRSASASKSAGTPCRSTAFTKACDRAEQRACVAARLAARSAW